MDDPFALEPPSDSPEPDPGAEEDARLIASERSYYLRLLGELPADRARLEERERDLVHYLRAIGVGWDKIGEALEVTGDEALAKHGEPPPGSAPF